MKISVDSTFSAKRSHVLIALVLALCAQLSVLAHDLSHSALSPGEACQICVSQDHHAKACKSAAIAVDFQPSCALVAQPLITITVRATTNDHNPRAPPHAFNRHTV